ncbi:MAG: nucleotidyl transferase AbiEii/AbiGii toxin family protein [Ilumatobacteraceae bacterium]
MISLVDRIVAIAEALDAAQVPWAFGGAFALAYATEEPRGTRDIDVNVFVATEHAAGVFAALPRSVGHGEADVSAAERDGQVRLWWDDTPVDIFFAESPFHHDVDRRCRVVPFAGRTVRILSAEDLAVFKAMFDRPKDWVDIATMAESHAVDLAVTAERLRALLGDDARVGRLQAI